MATRGGAAVGAGTVSAAADASKYRPAGMRSERRERGSAFLVAPVRPPSKELVQQVIMRHYADADEMLPVAVRGAYSACDLFAANPGKRPKPKKESEKAMGLDVLEHIGQQVGTVAKREAELATRLKLQQGGKGAEDDDDDEAEPEPDPNAEVELSFLERVRVQRILDDLQMPQREQVVFAAKYTAPGCAHARLFEALPLYEEAAAAIKEVRNAAFKAEQEVLEAAKDRATRAAEALASLGDVARFRGRPFAEVVADTGSGGDGGDGGAPSPPGAAAPASGDTALPPLS